MAKNTSTFLNDIKNYDIIRNVIRHIYMYGNYSKGDIVKNNIVKSERSLYDILKRIENYLDGEYLRTHKLPNRKKDKNGYRLRYDPFLCPINYLADTYQNCSYVIEDFIFYFTLMQSFTNPITEAYSHFEIEDYSDDVSELDEYSEYTYDELIGNITDVLNANEDILQIIGQSIVTTTTAEDIFTAAKARDRFNELLDLGIISHIGNNMYRLTDDIFEYCDPNILKNLQLMTQFFYNFMFLSVPGYYLSFTITEYINANYYNRIDTFFNKQENPVFFYKNNRLQNVIDDDVLWFILCAIHNLDAIKYKYRTKKGNIIEIDAFPIKVVIDKQYGRHYYYGYNYAYDNYFIQRIDAISGITFSKKYSKKNKLSFLPDCSIDAHKKIDTIYREKMKFVWNITTSETTTTVLIHFTFPKSDYSKLLNRLIATGRNGNIEKISENSIDYSIKVQSEREMIPWIRSFGSYAVVDKSTNPDLYSKIKNDCKEALKRYGIVQ